MQSISKPKLHTVTTSRAKGKVIRTQTQIRASWDRDL